MGKALLGSVAEMVLRQSDEPVLVIGPDFRPGTTLEGQRFVVRLEGSSFAEGVIPASAWAEKLGMRVWLIEVVSPDTGAQLAGLPAVDVVESSHVAGVAETLPLEVNWDVLHARHPADAIVDLAHGWPVGLLALATHGCS